MAIEAETYDLVREQLKAGKTEAELRTLLQEANYSKEEIMEVFLHVQTHPEGTTPEQVRSADYDAGKGSFPSEEELEMTFTPKQPVKTAMHAPKPTEVEAGKPAVPTPAKPLMAKPRKSKKKRIAILLIIIIIAVVVFLLLDFFMLGIIFAANGGTGGNGDSAILDCGITVSDGDAAYVCFEDAWAKCEKAKLTLDATEMGMTIKSYYEIKGGTPKSCSFYSEIIEASMMPELEGKDLSCTGIDATLTPFADVGPTTEGDCTGSLLTA